MKKGFLVISLVVTAIFCNSQQVMTTGINRGLNPNDVTLNDEPNLLYTTHPPIPDGIIIKPFKDDSGWGLINSQTREIVVPPVYKHLVDFVADSLYIFYDEGIGFGVLDAEGTVKVPFKYYYGSLGINKYDSLYRFHGIQVFPLEVYGRISNKEPYLYFINEKGNCLITNYYTCPANVLKEPEAVPEGMVLIQEAEYFKWKGNIDSAVYYCKRAINADSTNAYFYYWGCRFLILNQSFDIGNVSRYFPWITMCLSKAESLEKDIHYLYRIKHLKYRFYRDAQNDKAGARFVKLEMKSLKKMLKQEEYPDMWLRSF